MGIADRDDEIARLAGRDVDVFLASEGEVAFRALERQVLREAAGREGCVVATGGGAVLGGEAFEALAGPGLVIWLDVPLEELVQRARTRPRPALTDLSVAEEVARLDALRGPLYEAAADIVLGPADGDPILTLLSRLDPRHDDEP